MKIQEIEIESLIPYENNNKIHDDLQIERIANSIAEFGFLQPVVIDKNNVIVVGHGRVEGAKKLGMTKVPCICADELTEEQIKKYRIIDNKLNESEWNFEALNMELKTMGDLNFGQMNMGDMFKQLEFQKKDEGNDRDGKISKQRDFENKEIDLDDLGGFEHKCPKCGFEFNEE